MNKIALILFILCITFRALIIAGIIVFVIGFWLSVAANSCITAFFIASSVLFVAGVGGDLCMDDVVDTICPDLSKRKRYK